MNQLAWVCFALILPAVQRQADKVSAKPRTVVDVSIGQASVALNGPWKFRTGDDPHWADADLDDSSWETVGLTPAKGAHDGDVGLSGYVAGWGSRGHPRYSGYAWYRMRIRVNVRAADTLALAGPPAVDDAYQLFVDGNLLGSAGDFSRAKPVQYSIQPRVFRLPSTSATGDSIQTHVIAFRVWMSPGTALGAADAGGIHIAPALGEIRAIDARYRLQWLQTVTGYIVDVIEPVMFIVLAIMVAMLMSSDRSGAARFWLAGALVCTALARVNQATFFWMQWESIRVFDVVRNVILTPLVLAAWTMAWREWFRVYHARWFQRTVFGLTVLYLAAELVTRSWMAPAIGPVLAHGGHVMATAVRVAFVALWSLILYAGARRRAADSLIAIAAASFAAIAVFAQELSTLHVPGIWFPFGVGVSRTQYAFAVLAAVLFVLLLRYARPALRSS
ncbi:MAG: glycoside hydrolase [Gemmatimonadaceae bacterium]